MKPPPITIPVNFLSYGDTESQSDDVYRAILRDLQFEIPHEEFEEWEERGKIEELNCHFRKIAHLLATYFETDEPCWIEQTKDYCEYFDLPIPKALQTAKTLEVTNSQTARAKRQIEKDVWFYEMLSLVLCGVSVETAAEIATYWARFFLGRDARITASTLEKQFPKWRKDSDFATHLKSWFEGLSEAERDTYRTRTHKRAERYSPDKYLPKHLKGNRRGD
ncbi:hypothetical protein MWU63_06685 [Pseudohalocynthiibacter sp. F2068]|nr:hypothetical protein [Pseudohalocynthiibacter sp. F2068]